MSLYCYYLVPKVVMLIVEKPNDSEAYRQRNRSSLLPPYRCVLPAAGWRAHHQIHFYVHATHTHTHTHTPYVVFANTLAAAAQASNASQPLWFQGHVLFRPTVGQQQSCPTCSTSLMNGDFKVTYDVNRDKLCDLLVSLKLLA